MSADVFQIPQQRQALTLCASLIRHFAIKNEMVRQDLKNQLKIPLILTTIFVVLSFVPLVQILILTFDGGLISVINKAVGEDKTENLLTANVIANLLPTVLLLFSFFKATRQSTKIITSTLSMILLTAFIFFLTDGITKTANLIFSIL